MPYKLKPNGKKDTGAPTVIDVEDVIEQLNIYIDENEEPLIQDFTLNYPISDSRYYELIAENIKLAEGNMRAIKKQEVYMIRNASKKLIDPQFTMFRLKQKAFGYKDKIDISADLTNSMMIPESLRNLSASELQLLLEQAKDS